VVVPKNRLHFPYSPLPLFSRRHQRWQRIPHSNATHHNRRHYCGRDLPLSETLIAIGISERNTINHPRSNYHGIGLPLDVSPSRQGTLAEHDTTGLRNFCPGAPQGIPASEFLKFQWASDLVVP
jgi:hypothetical protein